jgi:NAD(P)-dependent dehydrogenase (short-subunit alcohol dehydrogenase family)
VTGGTGAIGLAIASAFMARGARVAVAGSSAAGAARARSALGEGAATLVADLRDAAALGRMLEEAAAALGAIAVLVNCAGVNFNRAIAEVGTQEYDAVMDLNVRAAFFASQWAAGRMAAAGIAGRIVNITSGNYRYTRPNAALYSASKAALEMLTRSFALEYGAHGITVNAVAPGLVSRPEPLDADFRRVAEFYVANTPLRSVVEPREVAAAVLFLASEQAGAITGDTIVVDNGFSAGRLDFPRRTQKR